MNSLKKLVNRRLTSSFRHLNLSGLSTTANCSQGEKYEIPVIRPPNLTELYEINEKFGLGIPYEELSVYKNAMSGALKSFQVFDKFPEINPPVKYPRLGGSKPPSEENTHRAWYVKTDIKGADDGPLKGKTVAVKDNIAVSGVPMMNGAKVMEGYVPEYDATVVTRVLDAGGRILGKSNCEYLCMSGNSHTCAAGPIMNPHDKDRSAGGSSGGSSVLVTLKEVDIAIGGDQGGSIRLPSCWSGCIGLKPTFGVVPYTGAFPIAKYVDHLGPITSTVDDAALFLEVLAGRDDMDCRQPADLKPEKYTEELKKGFSGLKVGIVKEGFKNCDENVEKIVKDKAFELKSLGLDVTEISVPLHEYGSDFWNSVGLQSVYQQLLLNYGITTGSYGHQPTTMHKHLAKNTKTNGADLSSTVKLFWLMGEYIEKNYEYEYFCKGANKIPHLKNAYNKALEKYDVLVMPTIKFPSPKLPVEQSTLEEIIHESLTMIENTCPFNVTWHPALTINAGYTNNLPVGLQIIGKHFHESTVLRVAKAVEQLN